MDDDAAFLSNYKSNTVYVHPAKGGAYTTLVSGDEKYIAEVDVNDRIKIAVSVFHIADKDAIGTVKLTKLKHHKLFGWQKDGELRLNNFEAGSVREFLSILSALKVDGSKKARIALDRVTSDELGAVLGTKEGKELIRAAVSSPAFTHDVFALASKRRVIEQFHDNLQRDLDESVWQRFFEDNPWIFGFGVHHVFLDKVGTKWEQTTTGSTFNKSGKRVDALARTRAEISQFVFIEIKKSGTPLLQSKEYRPGCWGVSTELSNAVTQIQKTVFDFERGPPKVEMKDDDGNGTNDQIFAVHPKSYLIAGRLSQLAGNDDKITSFELYRRELKAPDIVTFDELYFRTRLMVDNLSKAESQADKA